MTRLRSVFFSIFCLVLFSTGLFSCNELNDPTPSTLSSDISAIRLTFIAPEKQDTLVYQINTTQEGMPVSPDLTLSPNTTYQLHIDFLNTAFYPTNDGYYVNEEILDNADEHQVFFQWNTNNLFNGRILYNDRDEQGLPVGLTTSFITGTSQERGNLEINLRYFPNLKSENASSTEGLAEWTSQHPIIIQ